MWLISFDFCAPPKEEILRDSPSENLGAIVFGERIRPSIYKVCSCLEIAWKHSVLRVDRVKEAGFV